MSQTVGVFAVATGTNLTLRANTIGSDWAVISGSPISNITQDSEYKCNSLVTDLQKVDTANLKVTNENPNNRQSSSISIR